MPSIFTIKKYFSHRLSSHGTKGFGIHSPFIFDMVTKAFKKDKQNKCFREIEKQRFFLKHNKTIISVNDFGSGSVKLKNKNRRVCDITKFSLKPKRQARLLFSLIKYYNYNNILEIGTSLGITTCYMACATKKGNVVTLEGSNEISNIAERIFKELSFSNIQLIPGEFNDTLSQTLKNIKTLDFVFFDGNHTYSATKEYFNLCLKYKHNNTMFVIDDIYLSEQMTHVWEYIKNHPDVTVTIDLFWFGLVFFKKELSKQHFKIHF